MNQTDPFVPPAAEGLPAGTLEAAEIGANRLDAWARTPHGRNFLAHALVQLARTGWLRTEPGEGFEPVRDREDVPEPQDPAELRRMADEEQPATKARPRRGDQFEQWLKAQRDAAADYPEAYQAADGLLDLYRLHADTGTPLGAHVCEGRVAGDCECLEAGA